MEGKVLRSTKSKTTKRRGKTGTQTLLKPKTRTKSMQRRAPYRHVSAKENRTSKAEMICQELGISSSNSYVNKLQKPYCDLSCKENILETTAESLSNLLQVSNNTFKTKNDQPASSQSHFHQIRGTVEIDSDSFVDHVYTPISTVIDPAHLTPTPQTECSTRLSQLNLEVMPYQTNLLSPPSNSPSPPNLLQKQKSCKIRISNLLSSGGLLETYKGARCPLPNLQWTSSEILWLNMRSKDTSKTAPEAELRNRHPGILSSMRIILLDWMMEVCEEYRLHRETFYLAMDLFDRFMDLKKNVLKEQLQLLGVTCLFIAAKIEEIYPPKAAEFAYVTDGACLVEDILDKELTICEVLEWKLNHNMVTPNTWVNTYMQLSSHHLRPSGIKAKDFDFPAYSSTEFSRVMKLLDLCTLDISSRQFGSSVLAASAVYLQSERSRTHLSVMTGYELKDIQMCVTWMHPCAIVLGQKSLVAQKTFPGVPPHDTHNIQTHDVSISMLEDSIELRKSHEAGNSQYMLLQDCSILMTPPRTERRCLAPINTSC